MRVEKGRSWWLCSRLPLGMETDDQHDELGGEIAALESRLPPLRDDRQFAARADLLDALDSAFDALPGIAPDLQRRADALRREIAALDAALFARIRRRIIAGDAPHALLAELRALAPAPDDEDDALRYDSLDALVSGVLAIAPPASDPAALPPEMVAYQPTPARVVLVLIARCQLGTEDCLVDLGAGLGHVPLLAATLSGARAIGIEIDAALCDAARHAAERLGLGRVRFVCADARTADLRDGTVFYLYTPFTGGVLQTVLERLRAAAAAKQIRICTYGPYLASVAEQPWLAPLPGVDGSALRCFISRL